VTPANDSSVGVIIVAAGSGQRFGNEHKVLANLRGHPLLWYSLETFRSIAEVREIVVVAGTHTLPDVQKLLQPGHSPIERVCSGGETRNHSVRNGFDALSDSVDLVAVHDAARPLVTVALALRVIAAAREHGAAVPAQPLSDTVCRVDGFGQIAERVPRESLRAIQTPQVARRELLQRALREPGAYTDEGGALHAVGVPVMTVDGCGFNMKVTWPDDLRVAEVLLRERDD
jgi:2-C-methyl-D-erythritol 4-phosphate cytidylyltransferase